MSEPQSVYVLFIDHGWEGLDFLGVYASVEAAQRAAATEAQNGSGWTDEEWEQDEVHGVKGPWERTIAGTQYRVTKTIVHPASS